MIAGMDMSRKEIFWFFYFYNFCQNLISYILSINIIVNLIIMNCTQAIQVWAVMADKYIRIIRA